MRHQFDGNRQPIYHCTRCEDTGFERGPRQSQGLECPGDGTCRIGHCGQAAGSNYTHTFTRPCYCRPTNPYLQDERKYMNDRSRKPEKSHDPV